MTHRVVDGMGGAVKLAHRTARQPRLGGRQAPKYYVLENRRLLGICYVLTRLHAVDATLLLTYY